MAVLIEAISVVVQVRVLEDRYPGGLDAYVRHCPNRTFCSDGTITRVGFMTPADVGSFISGLENKGLQPFGENCWNDVAVVDQESARTTAPCAWLSIGKKLDGPTFACSIEETKGPIDIHVPIGWKFEGSLSQNFSFTPNEEWHEKHEFLRSEGMTDIYLHRQTGKEVRVGRTMEDRDPELLSK